VRRDHAPFGPDSALWSYSAPVKSEFFSWYISGAQRLPNGNTLINAGAQGIAFEVTADKQVVWRCVNPFKDPPPPGDSAAKPFQAFPKDARDFLGMKDEQRKKLDEIDKELNSRLNDVLNAEQRKLLNEPNDVDMSKVPAGEYLADFRRDKLQLTDAQTRALGAIQAEFNPRITLVLTDDQKHKVDDFKKSLTPAPGATPRKPGNPMFRATRYALNYPAFEGRILKPGKTLFETQEEREHARSTPSSTLATAKTSEATRQAQP
jgi:hypothetical protein